MQQERRRHARYTFDLPIVVRAAGFKGTWLVANLSSGGAWVMEATQRPDVGLKVSVHFVGLSESLRLSTGCQRDWDAQVVRVEQRGFALRFIGGELNLEELLDRARSHYTQLE